MSVGKPHRQNSGFQLRYFLAGSCTTPDGAYVLMYGQQNDMQTKLRHAESQLIRRRAKLKAAEAKEARAQYVIDAHRDNSGSGLLYDVLQAEADLLDAKAEVMEIQADIPTWELNWEAAKQELADINQIMAELRPLCRFYFDDILKMSEAAQEEEWLGELKQRAENFLITAGTIPHDHFQTMRAHPQFKAALVPHIQQINQKIAKATMLSNQGKDGMASLMLELEQPKLLEAPKEG